MNAFGGILMKRWNSESPTILGSSHAAACGTRSSAARHRFSASLIAGLFANTARVTSPNEIRADGVFSLAALSVACSARTDKVVSNRIKEVVVFIDPGLRLKHGYAGKSAHHGRQCP